MTRALVMGDGSSALAMLAAFGGMMPEVGPQSSWRPTPARTPADGRLDAAAKLRAADKRTRKNQKRLGENR